MWLNSLLKIPIGWDSSLRAPVHHQKSLYLMVDRRGEAPLVPPDVPFQRAANVRARERRR